MINYLYQTPVYITKMTGHEKYKEQFYPYLDKDEYFWQLGDWDCVCSTTIGNPKNTELPWQDISVECVEHVQRFLSIFKPKKDFGVMCDSWLNRYEYNQGQEQHNHVSHNTHFSCAYMLKTPEKSGKFVFSDKNQDFYSSIGLYRYCDDVPGRTNYPKQDEGTLIIFPSNLDHYVTQNQSNQIRATISMNFTLTE